MEHIDHSRERGSLKTLLHTSIARVGEDGRHRREMKSKKAANG